MVLNSKPKCEVFLRKDNVYFVNIMSSFMDFELNSKVFFKLCFCVAINIFCTSKLHSSHTGCQASHVVRGIMINKHVKLNII